MGSNAPLDAGAGLLIFGITGGVLGLVIVFLLFSIFRSRSLARRSRSWPYTEAHILEAMAEYRQSKDGGAYYPTVKYEYSVNNQVYHSDQIRFGSQIGFGSRSIVQRNVNKYPIGSTQYAYYNPVDPSQAVLDRSTGGSSAMSGCLVGIFIAVIIFVGAILYLTIYGSQLFQQAIQGIFHR